jgi:hypothetical protein
MAYQVVCPKGHKLVVEEAHLGRQVTCPACGEPFTVPHAPKDQQVPPLPLSIAAQGASRLPFAPRGVFLGFSAVAGRPMLAVGLILVLLARGCDIVGKRGVDRAIARAHVAQTQFEDSWHKQRSEAERRIAILEEKETPTPEDAKEIQEKRKSLADLEKAQQKAARALTETTLYDLKMISRDAEANYQINSYWREMLFVFGAVVLALGLLMVSSIAQGAERWVSLMMLAIITFSLFIIGAAWMPIGH